MKTLPHTVVFDGTSVYIIPSDDLINEIKLNNVKKVKSFNCLNKADEFCEDYNNEVNK